MRRWRVKQCFDNLIEWMGNIRFLGPNKKGTHSSYIPHAVFLLNPGTLFSKP
jgi:hypothetical protein